VENIGTIGTNQVIEMDGGAGAYYGSVATATKDTVVLANDPSWFNTGISDLSGVSVAIVLGRGAGQQSFIKGANGRTITLIDPWKVIPDATSIVVITASEQNLIVAHNTFTNTVEQTILIARSVDSVVEDNVLKNSGSGIYLCGIGPYGGPAAFNPIINTDVLRNQIEVGDGDLIVPSRSVTV
jgi:hypothetical protein